MDGNSFNNQNNPPSQNKNDQSMDGKSLGYSIASLVCGALSCECCILSLYPFLFMVPFVLGILGIVFSATAKKHKSNNGMATAGLICGIIGLIFSSILIIFWILMIIGLIAEWSIY